MKVDDKGAHLPHHFIFYFVLEFSCLLGGRNLNLAVGKGKKECKQSLRCEVEVINVGVYFFFDLVE